jgi:hypothetical protein
MKYIIGLLVLIIIVIIFMNCYQQSCVMCESLRGLWIADEDFCDSAGVSGMMVYIDNDQAYIILYSGDTIVVEKKVDISYNNHIWQEFRPIPRGKLYRSLTLVDDDELLPVSDFMANEMLLCLDLTTSCMTWSGDDDTIYAKLWKSTGST